MVKNIIKNTEIPEFIKKDISDWEKVSETKNLVFLLPVFGPIVPVIGQPFFLVIDKGKSKGKLVFRDTPEWKELKLDDIY